MKPGKEVVLSVVIVACSSGLALMSSLIGPWLNPHALMIRSVQRFTLFRIPSECLVTAIITDNIVAMCEYRTG